MVEKKVVNETLSHIFVLSTHDFISVTFLEWNVIFSNVGKFFLADFATVAYLCGNPIISSNCRSILSKNL